MYAPYDKDWPNQEVSVSHMDKSIWNKFIVPERKDNHQLPSWTEVPELWTRVRTMNFSSAA